MSEYIQLKGISWDHSRGFSSIVATSQRFHELNPHIDITWSKRSLQSFADEPIGELAKRFDLLIIDHPWAGYAARTGTILPLNDLLKPEFMADLSINSVGKSHESYLYNGLQVALAIDAATPVAAGRMDLFEQLNLNIPTTWEELVLLATQGKVAIPGIPQDTLMSFYMVCSTLGENVCDSEEQVISKETGLKALDMLRDLGQHIDSECYDMNPIKVYEALTQTDEYVYSPFAYGYTNYSRKAYAPHSLKFLDMVNINGNALISTLGGTGLAISSNCNHVNEAAHFLQYAASEGVQKGVFFDNGGQPGHRKAWEDEYTNSMCNNFFKDTLPALDRAFLRPRYHGHMYFQDHAGAPIRDYMMRGGNPHQLLDQLNNLYRQSLNIT